MPMPKTAINEENGSVFRKNNIGLSRKALLVKTKPVTPRVEHFSNSQLWLGVLAANARHHSGACFLINYICHGIRQAW